jgi:hypothetical protein
VLHRFFTQQGSYPDELKSAANSIVCTTGGFLLRELFNVTPGIERPVSFPSKHCNAATARCDQCLEHDSCTTIAGQSLMRNVTSKSGCFVNRTALRSVKFSGTFSYSSNSTCSICCGLVMDLLYNLLYRLTAQNLKLHSFDLLWMCCKRGV